MPHAVHSLRDLLAADHKVYLHCTAGCNRAPLTALGYLTFVEMLVPARANEVARIGRAEPHRIGDEPCLEMGGRTDRLLG